MSVRALLHSKAFSLRPNPLRKPIKGKTAVSYLLDGDKTLLCVVYDADTMLYYGMTGSELADDAVLGAIKVTLAVETYAGPGKPSKQLLCYPETAVARPGYGPLVYDLTAYGLKKYKTACPSISPSPQRSPEALAFWARRGGRPLTPLGQQAFKAKYGVTPNSLVTPGKYVSRALGERRLAGLLESAAQALALAHIGMNRTLPQMTKALSYKGY